MLLATATLMACVSPVARADDLGNRAALMWTPYVEWEVKGPPALDNPFDVLASVTFRHDGSGKTHTTEMFYDGRAAWKFRFTGTRVGRWTFHTQSDHQALDGHTGTVDVGPNPDPKIRGFLTHVGNRYAVETGNEPKREAYLLNVYMGRVNFDAFAGTFGPEPDQVERKTAACLEEARRNGFEVIFVTVNNSWFQFGAERHTDHKSENPDPATFRVLEKIITTAHGLGGRVHLWAWGDESRTWTPKGVGGLNGRPDRRLQRYLAARLGPLPGWTMGYGFDLHEWTRPDDVRSWAAFLHQHFGWQHLLSARGIPLGGEHNVNSYDGFGRGVSLATTSGGPQTFQEIVGDLDGDLARPHLYEERHSYLRSGFRLDMDGTRRLLWWEAMAGGMGGFFGFYPNSPHPYPNPEQLRTHYEFWHANRRFRLDFERAGEAASGGVHVLRSRSGRHYALYQEGTSSMRLELSKMHGPQPAVAVDTAKEYREIDLGILDPKDHTIRLPHSSDWAVAVGDFADSP
jgi:hypothetical protein